MKRFGYLLLCVAPILAQQHFLSVDDIARLELPSDPQLSPDGKWIAYTVSTTDKDADKHPSNIWMVSWDGKQDVQLTYSPESESMPRWSPDGKFLAFLSSRTGPAKGTQVWVFDRRGGEAHQLTAVKEQQHIQAYSWSPDSRRLLLVLRESDEPTPEAGKPEAGKPEAGKKEAPPEKPKPLVIDRYHFKQDEDGYIDGFHYAQIYLLDLTSKKLERLTNFTKSDENEPVWSPDGEKIAFVSNQEEDPDRSEHSDIWVVHAQPNATPRRLTTYKGTNGGRPAWSPDSKSIAYLQGTDPAYSAYNMNRLAVVPADGSASAKIISQKLDRGVNDPAFTPDGRGVVAIVEDDRVKYPARFSVADGTFERLLGSQIVVEAQTTAAEKTALLATTDHDANEIFAFDHGQLRKLTTHNDALFALLKLGEVKDFSSKSVDGTEVHGVLTLPPDFDKSLKYPALLRIHGGPNGQDEHGFSAEHQFLAAQGYVVISVNYRGSAGRGQKYAESIFADWGHHEVEDLLGAVDAVVAMGFVDPNRLGIGGWSYGGILTDYTIASDTRFQAAISGAGSANQISMYGSDEYVVQYDHELGPPWKNPEAWVKISYPFFQADRIHTPTLFLGGDQDFNVPIIGGEQMYQALRTLQIPTELIIYPGQHHGISRPSFQRDRLERYVAWYDKYLKTKPAAAAGLQ
jgi:dipeptidyl aminopeptidase/acylaminoacyl peptidase